MPRIVLPDGSVKYYETEEELEEALEAQKQPSAPAVEPKAAPQQPSKPVAAEPKQEAPSWWDETLRTVSTAAVQIPTKLFGALQRSAQSMPTSMVTGGDPMAALTLKAGGDPAKISELVTKEAKEARRGVKAASLGITVPNEKGEVYKLGIPSEAPGGALLSEDGAIFKQIKPRTALGEGLADVGSAIIMSFSLPGFGGNHGANLATLRNAAKPSIQTLLRGGVELAKRVGADLPQDFLEELLIFAAPDPSEDQKRQVDNLLSETNPQIRRAMAEMLLADDDDVAKFYDKWLANALGNTAASGVIRSQLGVLNQTRRYVSARRRVGKEVTLDEIAKQADPITKRVQDIVEADRLEAIQRVEMDEVADLNSQFTSTIRDNIELLNDRVRGLSQADLAIQKASLEGEEAGAQALGVTLKSQEDTAEIQRLGDLIKARTLSLKEMDKLEARNPGYLSGANKTRYNRYTKQLNEYKDKFSSFNETLADRSAALEGIKERVSLSASQFESLNAARRSGIDTFLNELEPWFDNLETINNRRAVLAPDMVLTDDPYYQSYLRLKEGYDVYKSLGGKTVAQGAEVDPVQEQVRVALENRLFEMIQEEFDFLQREAGGTGPIDIDPAVYDAAQKLKEAPAGAAEQAVTAAEAVPPTEAEKAVTEAPAAAPKAEAMPDPWTVTDQVPLKTTETGNIQVDTDAVRNPGITEGVPQNKAARIRQAQVDLGLRDADQVDEIVGEIKSFTTEEAVDDYINYSNQIADLEAKTPDGISYDWDRSSTRSLERAVGKYDTQPARKLAILQALKRKSGKVVNYTPKALERAYKIIGKYANAESSFVELLDVLNQAGIKRQKVFKGLEDAHVEVFATAVELQVGSNRLLKVVDAMTTQADTMTPDQMQTYRALAAQEGLMLYQSVGDFMVLRNRASTLLSSFKTNILSKVQDIYQGAVKKARKGEDTAKYIENYITDIQTLQQRLAEEIGDDVSRYIGLPSNLKNVEGILNKFTNPDLEPDENDLALFNKVISQLTVAGANPESLGSLLVDGDEIVQRQIFAGGLSGIKTQTSFPVQAAIYNGSFWIDGLTTGKINRMWSSIPWLRDDEALKTAIQKERIYKVMLEQDFMQMGGQVAKWAYKGRLFNRSVITDALTPLDNTGRFGVQPKAKDPIRESQMLNVLNNSEGVSDTGIMGAMKRIFGEENAKTIRNHVTGSWYQFHDQFWLGDAKKELKSTPIGKYANARYNLSPQGVFDRFIAPRASGGVITPYESKLASGERLGGTLPLTASEVSTEFIGGLMANLYARAKAQIDIEDMVDATGRPMYVKGTKQFNDAVDKQYYEQYLRPISVGVGEKAEDIAMAVADRDAQLLALSSDMMMPLEDDAWKAAYQRLKARGDNGDPNWFLTFLTPYIKTPLNAHKHHFYYTQPIPGTPIPTGVALEAAVGIRRFVEQASGAEELSTKIPGFQSKLFSKDPAVRAQARSGLTLSTALNVGVLSLVESNALEVTGGQRDQYQEANGAYIPMYSVKIGEHWVPYRWIPYVGEVLAYAANFRDFRRNASDSENQLVIGSAIMAMGATLLDTPALAGVDTIISILTKPADAEYFILDFAERVGGVRFPGLRQSILRATNEAYGARPVLSGEKAGVTSLKQPDPLLGEELNYFEQVGQGFKDVLGIGKFVTKGAALFANRLGILPITEGMHDYLNEAVDPGDYRQAHWYKPGDIMYTGPTQASVMTTFLGRHWPVPNASDVVDIELFRHGIKPPGQVFQGRYGIVANDVMVNRFRRYLGTEYRTADGRSTHQYFKDIVENREPIPGYTDVFYKDLPGDPKNSLTLDGKPAPYIDTRDQPTQRSVLMQVRSEIIGDAMENFLRQGVEVVDPKGKVSIQPITFGAPDDAHKAFMNYSKRKSELEIMRLIR